MGLTKNNQEILGWRAWDVVHVPLKGFHLLSPSYQMIWDGPVQHTKKPTVDNCYGFYSLKDEPGSTKFQRAAIRLLGKIGLAPVLAPIRYVHLWHGAEGVIEHSGQIVEGDHGYRSEVATIRKLSLGLTIYNISPEHRANAFDYVRALAFDMGNRYDVDVDLAIERNLYNLEMFRYSEPASFLRSVQLRTRSDPNWDVDFRQTEDTLKLIQDLSK